MKKRVTPGDYSQSAFPKLGPVKRGAGEAVRTYRDGREECMGNAAGRREYKRRTLEMAERQNWICGCGCGKKMNYNNVTFQHTDLRSGGRQNDTTKPYINCRGREVQNEAWKADCNMKAGSVRR